ncbi:MAG: amidohydrolase family protein [Gemmatimonadetes bacterium]|nr:amidohydrolase family protein [Gemmatimonadota bacterium]
MVLRNSILLITFAVLFANCGGDGNVIAFVGATIIDGTGAEPINDAVMIVRDGRIETIGPDGSVDIPSNAERVDLAGRTVMPGLINTHGHVGDTRGLETGHYSEENVLRQLALYARYGVTTVNSLGGDGPEGIRVRDAQNTPTLNRARLYAAGAVVTGDTPDAARQIVEENAAMNVDFIKIRVDDNLGTASKMTPEIFSAVIEAAHDRGLRVASHVYYLEDAKALLRSGTDFVAHSVRDRDVDTEFIDLLIARDVCYSPTLTREVSTFVYEDVPEFFEDPFFLQEADPADLDALKQPERQQRVRESRSAQQYKRALEVALRNLKLLVDGGATIAFGTDTGPAARFQGYFEHMELALMADAGLSPMQILVSATGDAARCLGLDDVGTLERGKWADFVVLTEDPLADILNSRSIESVWIAGNRVPDKGD